MSEFVEGLAAVASLYDAFVLDQFGVIHDGRKLYPGSAEALARLAGTGKPVLVLTNSGKRAGPNRDRLQRMGVDPAHLTAVISSGEVLWRQIDGGACRPTGPVCIIGKSGDAYGFDDLGLAFTDTPEDAGLLLILGSNAPDTSLAAYRERLAPAAGRGIAALCANPDRQMLTSRGLQPAPGAIAAAYEGLGGRVDYVGKPHRAIYDAALAVAAVGNARRALCIGDSLTHDVVGARAAGCSAMLVRTGLSQNRDDSSLRQECRRLGVWA